MQPSHVSDALQRAIAAPAGGRGLARPSHPPGRAGRSSQRARAASGACAKGRCECRHHSSDRC
eukprot:7067705-Prymnesium_polylepis.1